MAANQEPTFKQKALVATLLERPRPIGTAAREVGYSENTLVDPGQLVHSKGFIKCLERAGVTDDFLAQVHLDHLSERDAIGSRALDMAYKVKGHYAPEQHVVTTPPIPEALKPAFMEFLAKIDETIDTL